jgi:uncharacterized membrane protein
MGNLFVVGFDEPNQAEGVHFKLQKLQSEGLVDLADVAVAVKDETGKAKLRHAAQAKKSDGSGFGSTCESRANQPKLASRILSANSSGRVNMTS